MFSQNVSGYDRETVRIRRVYLLHPQTFGVLWHWTSDGTMTHVSNRVLTIHGFSAGSLNGIAPHNVAAKFDPTFRGNTVVGALACGAGLLEPQDTNSPRSLHIVHYSLDQLCIWQPASSHRRALE